MKRILICLIPLLLASASFAADDPLRKEGYWSMHSVSTTLPDNKTTTGERSICRNHAYDAYMRELANKPRAGCKIITDSWSGGTKTTEMNCTVKETVIHTKSILTTAGDNAVHAEMHSTYTPPMYGMGGMTMIMDEKYIGACPAGVQPGDAIGADGKKIASWKH